MQVEADVAGLLYYLDRFSLQGVQGISDIITIPGLVNVDFADVKSIMCNSGTAMLGVGVSTGKNRAEEAAMVRIADKHSVELDYVALHLACWLVVLQMHAYLYCRYKQTALPTLRTATCGLRCLISDT